MWFLLHSLVRKIKEGSYLSKVADGIQMDKHSKLTFLGLQHLKGYLPNMPPYGITINDDPVLAEYHSLLIPHGVSYSAGALDYYFRGRLDVRVTWDKEQSAYRLHIINASGQALQGGAFTLYADDADGNRSPYGLSIDGSWSASSVLADGEAVDAVLQPPPGTIKGFTLVYKGTIGTDGNSALDIVDSGMAVAAYQFDILRFNIVWDPRSDIDLYLVDPNGTVIYYNSKVSDLGELDYDDIPGTGPEDITIKHIVDGDYQVWVNYFADHDDDDGDQITPIGVTLNTFYNGTDPIDTTQFTLTTPNAGQDRPLGVSGPSTQASWYVRKLLHVQNGMITQH